MSSFRTVPNAGIGGPPSWQDGGGLPADFVDDELTLHEDKLLAGKYRLLRLAGFGGMAQLWVARNEATGAEVCIKVLLLEQNDAESVERFRREAYAAARLSHRAIVRVFDLVELDVLGGVVAPGQRFAALAIVMELLHGETLGDALMKRGRLSVDEALDLAIPLFSALAHAHRAGVVHRDLKPDNVFLATDPDGHVTPKVLDFGVSKSSGSAPITFEGVVLGTPSFMSPEQARGARNVDARSDVFSAGILLYMMLAGSNPFETGNFHSVLTAILELEPPRIEDVPDPLWAVLSKALAKRPEDRFADAKELGMALRRASGRSVSTEPGVAGFRGSYDSIVSVPPVARAPAAEKAGPVAAPSSMSPPSAVDVVASAARHELVSHGAMVSGRSTTDTAEVTGLPPRRRRPVRLVAGITAVAAALSLAALVRTSLERQGDTASTSLDGERRASATGVAPAATPAPPAAKAAPVAAVASASAAPEVSGGSSDATRPNSTNPANQATDAGSTRSGAAPTRAAAPAGVSSAAATPADRSGRPPSAPRRRTPSNGGQAGYKEPSIVRDPGF